MVEDRELIVITSTKLNFYLIRENNETVELKIENKDDIQNTGNIYKGKVVRLLPSTNAVFVDIGDDREAFLPIKDANEYKLGQPLLVQVKRSAIGTKGAKLSEKIALAGKYLVLTPTVNSINISSKYKTQDEKIALKERIQNILEDYNENKYGYIIRTLACEATDEQIIEDFLILKSIWEKIVENFKKKKSPSLLYSEDYRLYSILKDYAGNFKKIIVDSYDFFKIAQSYIKNFFPRKNIKLELFKGKDPYTHFNLPKLISKILNPYVWLKSGGYLVIEETEALVVIDVNSGSSCKGKDISETAFNINAESCIEIAKHIRLRDLGGIIVVDFIDMNDKEKEKKLIKILEDEFQKDKRPVKIKGFTNLGLLELTRKKVENSLIKQLSQNCFLCNGKGYVKGIHLVIFEIEKKLQAMKPFAEVQIRINPLIEPKLKETLKVLELDKSVKIIKDKNLSIERFILERVA